MTVMGWNESAVGVRRFANDSIREVAVRFEYQRGMVFEFLCECGDLGCLEFVKLTLDEYTDREPGSVVAH
jgi:hypothetical protein